MPILAAARVGRLPISQTDDVHHGRRVDYAYISSSQVPIVLCMCSMCWPDLKFEEDAFRVAGGRRRWHGRVRPHFPLSSENFELQFLELINNIPAKTKDAFQAVEGAQANP